MSRYIKVIVLIACLLGTAFEVVFQNTSIYISPRKIVIIPDSKIEPWVEPDDTVYDFSSDNLGMIYFPNIDNFDQDYDYEPVAQATGTVRIPILTYHNIAPLPASRLIRDYYVSPEMLEEQLMYLSIKGYRSLTPKQFYDQLGTAQNPTQKSVMLTFDDGNYNNYKYAFPLLKKYGFIGVFYISSNRLAINPTQLKEMANAGMIIDSHSANHIDLTKETDPGALWNEINNSKLRLQSITKQTVYSFSYPGCGYNGTVIGNVRTSGYLIAVTCGKSIDHKGNARLALSRMHVYNDMDNFKKILSGIWEYPYNY